MLGLCALRHLLREVRHRPHWYADMKHKLTASPVRPAVCHYVLLVMS